MARGKKTGGGSRKGKPNKSTREVRELIDRVGKRYGGMRAVFEAQFSLAVGIRIERENKKGEKEIYEKEPSTSAAEFLAEYRYGKPLRQMEIEALEGEGNAFSGSVGVLCFVPGFDDSGKHDKSSKKR